MSRLNEQQLELAKKIMDEYLSAPALEDGLTPVEFNHNWDEDRIKIIENEIDPLVTGYLDGNIPLSEFKSKVDSINKRNSLWGFRGIKGQMFFNMVVNVADDMEECDQELKAAIAVPANEQIASSRIKTFKSYLKRIGDQWVEHGNTRHGAPKVGSVPFFLSYFWHIQNRNLWPIYYTNSVNTMSDLNIWQPTGDLAEDYLAFKGIYEELAVFFSEVSGKPFDLYEVEHVFWYNGTKDKDTQTPGQGGGVTVDDGAIPPDTDRLPESYVPPIVAVLPRIARHEEALVNAANRSGTTLERAFEKFTDAAFRMLGYETKLLGQGKGRVPDGLALALDDNYAILWDVKIRSNDYSMGTDDRTIREYITTQSREIKKRRSLKNIYYLIISSKFVDDYDGAIRGIKMETDVSEVSLVEADALVAMVDVKLRSPSEITLGPDGLQRIFSVSGIIDAEMVLEQLI
ncbi:hypothetical protein ACFL36_05935 [Thermodesulfobacteriota bacterium]